MTATAATLVGGGMRSPVSPGTKELGTTQRRARGVQGAVSEQHSGSGQGPEVSEQRSGTSGQRAAVSEQRSGGGGAAPGELSVVAARGEVPANSGLPAGWGS